MRGKKLFPVLGLIIAVAGIIVVGFFIYRRRYATSTSRDLVVTNQTLAPAGTIAKGFDQSLLIIKDAVVTSSKRMSVTGSAAGDLDEVETTFTTHATEDDIYTGYVSLLKARNYKFIENEISGGKAYLVAKITGETVVVYISSLGSSQRQVTISVQTPAR
jgi:hypothetical protein